MSDQTTMKILQFSPLQLELPAIEVLSGTVNIMLPSHHYTVKDLSMGGLIPGAHLGSDAAIWQSTIELDDNELPIGEIVEFIIKARGEFEQLHKLIQARLDERGPLLQ